MRRGRFAGWVMATLMVLALAGAVQAQTQTKITVGVFPDFDALLEVSIEAFEELHPEIDVEMQVLGYADHHDALLTALAAGSGAPDVAAVEIGYLGRFAAQGGLTDLSEAPFRAQQYAEEYVPFSWGLVNTTDGRIVALPTDTAPGTMFYRTDVLEAAGLDVSMVETWNDLVDLGRKVTRDVDGDGANDHYLIANASTLASAIYRGDIPEGEGIFFDNNGRPVVNSPRFVKAFTVAQTVRQEGLDAEIGAWTNEWYESFKRGTGAVEISGAWLAGHLANWMAPDTKGLWRARDLPENMYVNWGGSFWAIPEQSNSKEAAWEFIKFMSLTTEQQLNALRIMHAFPAYLKAFDDAIFDEPVPFLGGQKARKLWYETVQKIDVVNIHRGDPVAQEIIDSALTEVLEEGRDVESALQEAQGLVRRRVR